MMPLDGAPLPVETSSAVLIAFSHGNQWGFSGSACSFGCHRLTARVGQQPSHPVSVTTGLDLSNHFSSCQMMPPAPPSDVWWKLPIHSVPTLSFSRAACFYVITLAFSLVLNSTASFLSCISSYEAHTYQQLRISQVWGISSIFPVTSVSLVLSFPSFWWVWCDRTSQRAANSQQMSYCGHKFKIENGTRSVFLSSFIC